jgi:hypothetical protein
MQRLPYGTSLLLKPLTGLSVPEVVSAAPLTFEPFLELDLRDWPRRVQVDPLAPHAPDPTPTPHKRQILEERRFDQQDVKSRYVLGAVDPFEHKNLKKGRVVCVRVHGQKLRRKNSVASNE